MIKGEIVEFTNPSEDEIGLKFTLLEDPDGGRVCAEALVDMAIRPCYILRLSDIRLASKQNSEPSTTKRTDSCVVVLTA